MFEDRGNFVGVLLLALCGISALYMLGYINRGELPAPDWPLWVKMGITIAGMGLIFGSLVYSRRAPKLGNDVRPTRKHEQPDQADGTEK